MLSDEWLSRYGLLENFNASVTRTGTRTGTGTHTGTGTWTTGVTAIALCTSCSRAKNEDSQITFTARQLEIVGKPNTITENPAQKKTNIGFTSVCKTNRHEAPASANYN